MDQDLHQPTQQEPVGNAPVAPATPPVNPEVPTMAPPVAHTAAPTAVASADAEPRNFLAAFLFATFGGVLALRNFYLGQKNLGFIRLGLFFGGIFVAILAVVAKLLPLSLIGGLAYFAAIIWAIVDFFVVYFSVRTDADGQPLTMTKRDHKWAAFIFWLNIAAFVLVVFFYIVAFSFASSKFKDIESSSSTNSLNNSSLRSQDLYQYNTDSSTSSGSSFSY